MKKYTILILLVFINGTVSAYEVEDYVSVLQWKGKWDKISSRAIDGYVSRGIKYYPSDFTVAQSEEASKNIRAALNQKIGWDATKDTFISGFMTHCGDELLNVMVEFYERGEFTQEDKDLILADYGSCATAAIQGTMSLVINEIEKFSETKNEILSRISAK